MKKIKMCQTAKIKDIYKDFLTSRKVRGVSEKTLETYSTHLHAMSKHLDIEQDIADLKKRDLENMIASMRESGLASNTINSYTRTLKTFLSWCNREGYTSLNIPLYKAEETIKETYTDAELKTLLKKPNVRECTFAEFRNWAIINFLLNSGCRAATVRGIQIRDLDLDNGIVYYRHTKNKKAQVIPLCSPMTAILREYLRVRGGGPSDYLFCAESGEQLKAGRLTAEKIEQAVAPQKREEPPLLKITLTEEDLRPYFPDKRTTIPDVKRGVFEALDLRKRAIERQKAKAEAEKGVKKTDTPTR